ncbi:hypothetical protein NQ317_012178 [Molorchus minor]|uniref:Artemis n=1 Tax=Molorchus minor TaxID=1323400 RepID=A0ABQ9K3C8_9CUCU|nr:hypothetical protein NQ317_012178 [Molorchus minor]
MSTFGGKIEEIPGISVDRFDEENFYSEAYFLSHCHSDHMVGLNSINFQETLIKHKKFIYMSNISCAILQKMYPLVMYNIKVLDIYKPTIIALDDKTISVTPIPAGHCPGSVMFLFESGSFTVLYTGDYRINKRDIRKFKSFYNSLDQVKTIDKIYLDTTFFSKSYLKFPKRDESVNELCNIIKEWTDNGTDYIVQLLTSAKYGYEYVFNEIYKRLKMPVHVNPDSYRLYSNIPEMDNSVTLDGSLTQIHSNCGATYQSMCLKDYSHEIRRIKVSAYRWTQDNLDNGLSSFASNTFYVCYSTHASYEEGMELLRFLKPRSIEACVRHDDDPYINLEIDQLITESLTEFNKKEVNDCHKPKLFETTASSMENLPDSQGSGPCYFNDNLDIFDSPPRESTENLKRFVRESLTSSGSKETIEVETESSQKLSHRKRLFNFDEEFGIVTSTTKDTSDVLLAADNEKISTSRAETKTITYNEQGTGLKIKETVKETLQTQVKEIITNEVTERSDLLNELFFQDPNPSQIKETKNRIDAQTQKREVFEIKRQIASISEEALENPLIIDLTREDKLSHPGTSDQKVSDNNTETLKTKISPNTCLSWLFDSPPDVIRDEKRGVENTIIDNSDCVDNLPPKKKMK